MPDTDLPFNIDEGGGSPFNLTPTTTTPTTTKRHRKRGNPGGRIKRGRSGNSKLYRENALIQTFPSPDANLNAPHINLTVRVDGQVVADHDEEIVPSLAAEGNPSNDMNQYQKQHKRLRSSRKKVVYHQKRRIEDRAED